MVPLEADPDDAVSHHTGDAPDDFDGNVETFHGLTHEFVGLSLPGDTLAED